MGDRWGVFEDASSAGNLRRLAQVEEEAVAWGKRRTADVQQTREEHIELCFENADARTVADGRTCEKAQHKRRCYMR